jgi:protease secretion system membrane fusion protein
LKSIDKIAQIDDSLAERENVSVKEMESLSDTRRLGVFGLLVLLIGCVGFFTWAALVPLDQGVPSPGYVSVDTKRKPVQHLQGGIVREVLVREGDWVELNQPLMRLDDSMTRADYEGVRQQYFTLKAVESRLLAEQKGSDEVTFDRTFLMAAQEDARLREQMVIQLQLMRSRRQSLKASIEINRESAVAQEALISSTRQIDDNLKIQKKSLEGELLGVRDMVREGYLPVSRQLEMERQLVNLRTQIVENGNTQIRARQAVLEAQQRETITKADFAKEIEQQLGQLRPEIQAIAEKFKAYTQQLEGVQVRSPAKGQVVGLSVQSVGSVLQPGQRIADIVPANENLLVEARVESHLIDRVRAGSEVDLRFAGFSGTSQLVVSGGILSLSSDTVTDPASPQSPPFYLARIKVTTEGMKELGSRTLQPGMPVDVVFKTGQRTLLEYIIHPLTKRMAVSLKEE